MLIRALTFHVRLEGFEEARVFDKGVGPGMGRLARKPFSKAVLSA